MVDVMIADFSPTSGVQLVATTAEVLGFHDSIGPTWFSVTGLPCTAPASPTAVATAWRSGLGGHSPPASVSVEAWAGQLEGSVERAQAAGDAVLVDLVRGANDVRSLWWCLGTQATRVRERVGDTIRVEAFAARQALLLDPDAKRFELLAPNADPIVIPLPRVIEQSLASEAGSYRVLAALPDGLIVLASGKRAYWFSGRELAEAAERSTIEWRYTWVFPRGDRTARVPGTVTMSAYGRTNIEVAGTKLSFGPTKLEKGEKVTLVDLLWNTLGAMQFREVVRANGQREDLPGAPYLVGREETAAQRSKVKARKLVIPAKIKAAVAALREESLASDLDDAGLRRYADGLEPLTIRNLLLTYYGDGEVGARRARADRFLTHDWRFGQETDDVIAELMALLDGPPLFRQVEVLDGAIVVDGPSGRETIVVEFLDDVVGRINQVLQQTGSATRIVAFDNDDDQLAYFALRLDRIDRLRDAGIPIT